MDIKKELTQISSMLYIARGNCEVLLKDYVVSGTQLDCILNQSERAVIRLRTLAEAVRSRPVESGNKPAAPEIPGFVGKIEVSDFGWVHITLNSLLPSCKYKTPYWLQNTLSALLTGYQKNGRRLPRFERAMLIIEEHCDLQSRQVYDQDNKGWKAIPNAIKGVLVPDDDQFTLEVALLSRQSETVGCHIWVLPAEDAGEYFSVRSGSFGYGVSGLSPW